MTGGYKRLIQNYTFDQDGGGTNVGTITLTDFVNISLENVILITNVVSNVLLYNFVDNTLGGTVATNVLTLTKSTVGMADADKLEIWYWDDTASLRVDSSGQTQPVSGAVTANAGTNLNTSALALEAGHLANIDTKTPALGQALAAACVPVTLTALEEGLIGALTEAAPATDTASSGLNGRLQRIAQRLTTMLTGIVLSAGSAIIGKVTTDQTTHGTTDLVAADITKIAGGAINTSHGIASGCQRVELASDGTGKVGLNAGSAIIGITTTDQTTHGTTDLVAADVTKVGGTAIVTAKAGCVAVGGPDATNVAPTANPQYNAGLGQSSFPTANTAGRITAFFLDLFGRMITKPFSNAENDVGGIATVTGTTSTSCIASAGASTKNVVTGWAMSNSGATAVTVLIQDGSSGTTLYGPIIVPAGGGNNMPLITNPEAKAGSANTAVFIAASGSTTSLTVQLWGYKHA